MTASNEIFYVAEVTGLREFTTDEPIDVRVAALLDKETNEFVVRIADIELTVGQARLLLAKVASAVGHLDYLVRVVPA